MKGKERREKIIELLSSSDKPITGKKLAEAFGVSRQVIVQDMALLRAEKYVIISTTLGYVLENSKVQNVSRVFKVYHNDAQVADELNLIVDFGGSVDDVFVFHKIYGVVSAKMDIKSRNDVECFVKDLSTGESSLIKNVTGGYHYHTVSAPTNTILDLIQRQLEMNGFLAKLQDYEPVDFWKDSNA